MEFVEQVKSSVDIVSVVRDYLPRLTKRGTRWIGLCPFHSEKSPSFGVHEEHQFYKCFGCGAGGDVFNFVKEIEGITFYEALKMLAERQGLPMPQRSRLSDPESSLRGSLYDLHELAGKAFRQALASGAGSEARAYLERRGVSREIAGEFGLGYAEPGGQALFRCLQKEGYNAEQMRESGLVIERNDGSGWFDRFRNRLMFPIHNETGKIIAFAGRALAEDDQPKYMNSPETKIYRKQFVLYNLHRAKSHVRKLDRSILVEGYMDVIGLAAANVQEVVASCGTALTSEQIRVIRRHSERLVVNFDPDAAGSNAAERSIQLLLDEGIHIKVLELEDGLDPDEYVRARGEPAYRQRLEKAGGYFHWLADRARARFDMRTAEGRMEGLKFLLPAIQRITDKLERAAVAGDVASYLGVDAGLVLEQFRKSAERRASQPSTPTTTPLPPLEQMLLTAVLRHREVRAEVLPELEMIPSVERFQAHGIFRAILQLAASGGDWGYNDLEARLEEPDRALLAAALFADHLEGRDAPLAQARECLRTLRDEQRRAEINLLKQRIKQAERNGDMAEVLRLMEDLNRAEKEKC